LVCRQKRSDTHSVYALIATNQAESKQTYKTKPAQKLSVHAMCKHLKVSKSGYYDWLDLAPSARSASNVALLAQIKTIHAMSDATYGMPRIRAELLDQGIVASRKRIANLMKGAHIQGVSLRRGYTVTIHRNVKERPAPDLVKRQFVATDINQLWVADMKYIPIWAGFLYLAVVTDVYSRKGWAGRLEQTLTCALE